MLSSTCSRTRLSGGRAFSFVELLIAGAVISAVSVAMFIAFSSGAREAKTAEDRLKALAVAQQELERIKQIAALGRGSLEQFWSSGDRRTRSYVVDDFYHVLVTVDPKKRVEIAGSQAEVGEATVVVNWSRPGKGKQSLTVTTLFDQAYY